MNKITKKGTKDIKDLLQIKTSKSKLKRKKERLKFAAPRNVFQINL
jgi:hypothetical protein